MPPVTPPKSLRQLAALSAAPANTLKQFASRQGLEGTGRPGPPGPPGPTGGTFTEKQIEEIAKRVAREAGVISFVFTEASPAEVWTIKHDLGLYPVVLVQTTEGDEVEGVVDYVSANEITITFSSVYAGTAYLN